MPIKVTDGDLSQGVTITAGGGGGQTFTWKRLHTIAAVAFTVLGVAVGGGAQIALSKAELGSHEVRIDKLEAAQSEKALHDVRRDAQFDDLIKGVDKININMALLGEKLEALSIQTVRDQIRNDRDNNSNTRNRR